MTPQIDISVCILTHSQPVLLPQCVAACLKEFDGAGLKGEIIVIDNASKSRYPEKLAAEPAVRVIRNETNLGFGAANNRAIRAAAGSLLLILNDDAILGDGTLSLMLSALRSSPRVGAVGPALVFPDGSLQAPYMNKRVPNLHGMICELLELDGWLRRYEWARRTLTLWDKPERRGEPEQLAGACVLLRRQALDEVGLFDEGFYYILEDADLSYRLRKGGWRILCVYAARVTHYGAATFIDWGESARLGTYFRSVMYYFRKHASPPKYLLARVILTVVTVVTISRKVLFHAISRAWHGESYNYGGKVRAKLRLLKSIFSAGATRRTTE